MGVWENCMIGNELKIFRGAAKRATRWWMVRTNLSAAHYLPPLSGTWNIDEWNRAYWSMNGTSGQKWGMCHVHPHPPFSDK